MSLTSQQWGEFLSCPVCYNMFNDSHHQPISLACSHSLCRACIHVKLQQKKCPFDHTPITRNLDDMPVNSALLQLVGVTLPESVKNEHRPGDAEEARHFITARNHIENFANYLKPMISGAVTTTTLSRPILKKLITLINCQLIEEEGRSRLVKIARSIGERTITEMILQHQNPQQLSANLWAAVRTRGCQFLGPAMQEEVLKLILLALEDGSALTRKVLVLFVVQRLQAQYPQASKTAIGHVVQLLYRASCFMVTKREEESSLMQLKEEFRTYEGLRREHDAQIVQIATEAGLRIAPDQWSSLLYGDTQHKSHMQSIIDKLQTPQSFGQAVNELSLALQRSGDPSKLGHLSQYFEMLAAVDPTQETCLPSMEDVANILIALQRVVEGLAEFCKVTSHKKVEPLPVQNTKFKTSMCRNFMQTGTCPRGSSCTFAHTKEEMERHRAKTRKLSRNLVAGENLTDQELEELELVSRTVADRLQARSSGSFSEDGTFDHDSLLEEVISPPRSSLSPVPNPNGVKVPTVQAPVMPVAKGTPTNYMQGIYSVPKHVMTPEDHRHQGRMGSANPTKMHGQSHHHHSKTTESNSHTVMTAQATGKPSVGMYSTSMGMQPHPPYWNVDDPYLRAVLSYTRHPYIDAYTGRIPGLEWGFKPESAISAHMGRSQSEQLDELRRRRVDILQQMNKTKQSNSLREPRMSVELEPTPANRLLARSVNDTIAASLTTAAHSRVENNPVITPSPGGGSMEHAERWCPQSPDRTDARPRTSSAITSTEVVCHQEEIGDEHSEPDNSQASSSCGDSRGGEWAWMHSGMTTGLPSGILSKINREECDDEFIPFSEHTMVSKYGPISRVVRSKPRQGGSVQVTASQGKVTTPVTAVTPVERPYPITSPVPSHFLPTDHIPDPRGPAVATSLPTAILKPNLMAPSGLHPNELETLVHDQYPESEASTGSPRSSSCSASNMRDLVRMEPEKLNHELAQVTHQIQSLQTSEDDRLARELQTVEMDILETQRKLAYVNEYPVISGPSNHGNPYHMTTLPHQAISLRDHEMAPAGLGHQTDTARTGAQDANGQSSRKPTVKVAPHVARPPPHSRS